jgi:hypothetical protein
VTEIGSDSSGRSRTATSVPAILPGSSGRRSIRAGRGEPAARACVPAEETCGLLLRDGSRHRDIERWIQVDAALSSAPT